MALECPNAEGDINGPELLKPLVKHPICSGFLKAASVISKRAPEFAFKSPSLPYAVERIARTGAINTCSPTTSNVLEPQQFTGNTR